MAVIVENNVFVNWSLEIMDVGARLQDHKSTMIITKSSHG